MDSVGPLLGEGDETVTGDFVLVLSLIVWRWVPAKGDALFGIVGHHGVDDFKALGSDLVAVHQVLKNILVRLELSDALLKVLPLDVWNDTLPGDLTSHLIIQDVVAVDGISIATLVVVFGGQQASLQILLDVLLLVHR